MIENKVRFIPQSLLRDLVVGTKIAEKPAILATLQVEFDYDYNQPPLNVELTTYLKLLEFFRLMLHRDKTKEAGLFLLGQASLDGHFQSPVGKINKVAARMLSIEKAAALYIKTQYYNYPFGKHEMEQVGKGYLRYHRSGVPVPPDFTRGVLTYLLQLSGAKDVKIIYRVLGIEEMLYEAHWS